MAELRPELKLCVLQHSECIPVRSTKVVSEVEIPTGDVVCHVVERVDGRN